MSKGGPIQILVGDCREQLRELPDASVDSIVCDPPYELTAAKRKVPAPFVEGSPYSRHRVGVNGDQKPLKGFMGKEWDGSGVAHDVTLWAEALRVLKPGGHLIAFGGTRTYHRLVTAIEDAGFEVRDQLAWVYGTGFPKSRDIGNGWGTALKPSWEPICLARKSLGEKNISANVLKWGTGALNIDGCRVGDEVRHAAFTSLAPCHGNRLGEAGTAAARRGTQGEPKKYVGRWPANLCHDGSDEVVESFPAEAGAAAPVHKRNADKFRNTFGAFAGNIDEEGSTFRGDRGSAARFFYCAKAARSERGEDNDHPTVKPQALMRWLCRLVTPVVGIVVDPFLGSGTTGLAALAEGFRFIGIELNPEYVAIAERRLGLDLA